MTKFHINKHGVPAPCKAKPGNCPLGGNDTHFDNMQDAQNYVDKANESKHGLLPSESGSPNVIKKEVSEEAFNETFPKSQNEAGFEMSGTLTADIMDDSLFRNRDPYKEVRDILPEYIKNRADDGNLDFLVAEDNLRTHIESHITSREFPEQHDPEAIKDHFIEEGLEERYIEGHDKIIDAFQKNHSDALVGAGVNLRVQEGPIKDGLNNYIEKELLKEATLEINGNKVYFENKDEINDRNWGEEYFNSNEYVEAKELAW